MRWKLALMAFVAAGILWLPLAGDDEGHPGPPQPEPPALSATPCSGGFAGSFPCANVDLLAFLPLSDLGGGQGNDIWGWEDPVTGREYALMGRSNGTAFVDITDPENPVYVGDLPTHSASVIWRDIKVYRDHAFVVSEAAGHGMQVFDLRQLRDVTAPPVTFGESAHYAEFQTAHNLAINEETGFAYAVGSDTCSGGLHMVDIQTPLAPQAAGCFAADGYTHDTQCVVYRGPDGAYQGRELCFSSNEDTLTITDVTSTSAPAQLSRTPYPDSRYAHQGWLTEDHAFFLMDDELDELRLGTNTRTHIWDVSNVDAPLYLGAYEAATLAIDHNLYIKGRYAYLANYRSGLRILDLVQIGQARLREVGYFDIYPDNDAAAFNGAWSNYPFFDSGVVVVSGIEQGLFVLRPVLSDSSEGAPNFTTTVTPASASVRAGDSATFTLTVDPQNSFQSSVSLACSNLPARASCSFSPVSLTPSGGPVSATVTLSTGGTTSAGLGRGLELLLPAVVAGMVLWPRRRRQRRAAGMVLVLALATVAAACGGGGSSQASRLQPPQTPTTTPPGSYTVQIRATSGSIVRSASVALTVQ